LLPNLNHKTNGLGNGSIQQPKFLIGFVILNLVLRTLQDHGGRTPITNFLLDYLNGLAEKTSSLYSQF
jgi:hypothetical protein